MIDHRAALRGGAWGVVFAVQTACAPVVAPDAAAESRSRGHVVLPDGRRLALVCLGQGRPTVVVDAGLGGRSTEGPWPSIAETVSGFTRICLHDRAGLGDSDPVAGERTSADAADDLHAALKTAGETGPFVLAGHSVGGLNLRVFAGRHPEATAALVLIDASHPDQNAAWRRAFPAAQDGEDTGVTQARAYLEAMDDRPSDNPERLNLTISAAQAREVTAVPGLVIVLTHAPTWRMVPGLPDAVLAPLEAETQRLQREQLTLSSRSRQFVSESGGHDLPGEDPELVVAGIRAAVDAVREGR